MDEEDPSGGMMMPQAMPSPSAPMDVMSHPANNLPTATQHYGRSSGKSRKKR